MVNEFSKILINRNATVKEAMKQLDLVAEKILFVVDESIKLIGSLSDGDIRRWILSEGSLNQTVSEVCFKDTFYVNASYDIDKVKEEILRRKIFHVPVIDGDNRIIEFLVWDRLFGKDFKRKPKEEIKLPVVIMAGGKGTRLEPFTKVLPKPLIPIGDKTIIEHIIERFLEYGVSHFYISINHKAKIIKSYFEELMPRYSITFIYEDKPSGTAGSLKQLDGLVKGNFILTNCDIIIDSDYNDLISLHSANNNDITMVASLKHYKIPYGVCELETGGTLKQINEKPVYDLLVNTGMYIIKSDMLKYIPNGEFYHITNLIEEIKKSGGRIGIYPISDKSWIDTGEWEEYRNAISKLSL